MAQQFIFTCEKCGFSISSWDDGNPYIQLPVEERTFFYHPADRHMIREIAKRFLGHESSTTECNEVVRKFGGNASDHICRECCEVSLIDPHKEKLLCESCGSVNVEETCTLGGKQCIKCDGLFSEGEPGAIS